MVETKEKKEVPEKTVEAIVVKHTSFQGRLLIKDTTVRLPLSVAKAMRQAGTVRPVPKVTESHPKPPPPKPPVFEGEEEDESSDDEAVEDDEE